MDSRVPLGLEAIGSTNMAPFLTKLFQIVSSPSTQQTICWTAKGDSFVISDPDTFAREILPTYFKHNNIRSFIRQLNTYGFRKRTNISSTDEHLEFFHEKFRRDEPALLTQIKRCHQSKAAAARAAGGGDMDTAALGAGADLDTIRGRVGELKNRLGSLQTEIRDYNHQMEQKVNLLMHILQTSGGGGGGGGAPGGAPAAPGLLPLPAPAAGGAAAAGAAGSLAPQPPVPSSAPAAAGGTSAAMAGDFLGRRDALLGPQPAGAGLAGGLGGGLGGIGGLAGGIGGVGAGFGAGLMGGLSGFGGLTNLSNPAGAKGAADGASGPGLQHLLEAAQRAGGGDGGAGAGQPAAKRFCGGAAAAEAFPAAL